MVEQISIYAENRRGAAREILSIIAKENVNILCLVNNDSGEFGTMRLIVDDSAKAMAALTASGYLCKKSQVLGTELDDTPGALEQFLEKIEKMYLNIDYMYIGYSRENNTPIIFFHCDDLDIVASNLRNSGHKIY